MHEMIEEIFKDAGATPKDLEMIELTALTVAQEARQLILHASSLSGIPPRFRLPLRVLLCRVVHADMQKAFEQYKTNGGRADLVPETKEHG